MHVHSAIWFTTISLIAAIVNFAVSNSWLSYQQEGSRTAHLALYEKLNWSNLPNAVRLNEKVVSGGLPDGEPAFAELHKNGVRTIISVDGGKPDVEAARPYGLRYVHLPHGYDGISPERVAQLARAVQDLPGPIYIHCHHGKHRSPAAAAAACRALGWIDEQTAVAFLTAAGTSTNYRGLYETVRGTKPLTSKELEVSQTDFPEMIPLSPTTESMVQIERIFERLKTRIAENNQSTWKAPCELAHDALLLREQFTELVRHEPKIQTTEEYQESMRDAESLARALETCLNNPQNDSDAAPANLSELLMAIEKNCCECHGRHRDIPLSAKPRHEPLK